MYKNNFDFLRLFFCLVVIFSHSFPLAGEQEKDFFYNLTNHQLFVGEIALAGFFSISGYLIYQSLTTSRSLPDYLKKRAYRVYPGFLVAITITVVICFFVSKADLKTYLFHTDALAYIYKKILLFTPLHHTIRGVFENNPYPRVVNASIWTIPYEVLFYLLLIPLFFIKNKRRLIILLVVLVLIGLALANFHLPGFRIPQTILVYLLIPFRSIRLSSFIEFFSFFMMGTFIAVFKNWFYKYRHFCFIAGVLLSTASLYYSLNYCTQYVLYPVTIVCFGIMDTPYVSGLSKKIGDLSYGTYIYAFVVQQALVYYFHLNAWQLTLATIPISLLFGFLSWHLVEKRFLTHKRKAINRIASLNSVPA